jgi:predicted transcriptional regulator
MNARLKDILERVQSWPEAQQQHALDLLLTLEQEYAAEPYELTEEEKVAIDRGLRDVAEGRFATDAEVDAMFAKHRRNS